MLIGIAGRKGCGKSTAAGVLTSIGYNVCSFAAPMKRVVALLLSQAGLTAEQLQYAAANKEAPLPILGCSYRHVLQTLGTEWGRQMIKDDFWLLMADQQWQFYRDVVFDDVRFDNEAAFIRKRGGLVVHLSRPGLFAGDGHLSEAGITVCSTDAHLANDGDEEQLLDRLIDLVETL